VSDICVILGCCKSSPLLSLSIMQYLIMGHRVVPSKAELRERLAKYEL
jgi:hypothetical protein